MNRTLAALLLCILCRAPAVAQIWHGCALAPNARDAWVCQLDSPVVVHSSDFGQTWESQPILTNYGYFDVFFLDDQRGWTCGMIAEVWHTTDAGSNWAWQAYGATKFFTRIQFIDPTHGWAAGGAALIGRWDEEQQTWIQTFVPGHADTADYYGVSFTDTLQGWMCAGRYPANDSFYGGQGIIIRTADGGRNWTIQARDTVNDYFDIKFADSLEGWVVGGNDRTMDGCIAHTTDGGQTWLGQSAPGVGLLRAVEFIDRDYGWAVGKYGTIAVVERLIRTMKTECTRRILVPLRLAAFQREISVFSDWYNAERPHASLRAGTPDEVYFGFRPACRATRFEPRPR